MADGYVTVLLRRIKFPRSGAIVTFMTNPEEFNPETLFHVAVAIAGIMSSDVPKSAIPCDPYGLADALMDAEEGDVNIGQAISLGMTMGLALAYSIASGFDPADVPAVERSAAAFMADMNGVLDTFLN